MVWYIFLILHASHFWKWFLVPAILYIIERILRSKWVKIARFGRTYIQEGILLPSKVGVAGVVLIMGLVHSWMIYPKVRRLGLDIDPVHEGMAFCTFS